MGPRRRSRYVEALPLAPPVQAGAKPNKGSAERQAKHAANVPHVMDASEIELSGNSDRDGEDRKRGGRGPDAERGPPRPRRTVNAGRAPRTDHRGFELV